MRVERANGITPLQEQGQRSEKVAPQQSSPDSSTPVCPVAVQGISPFIPGLIPRRSLMKPFDRTSIVLLEALMLLGLPATADDLPRRAHLGIAAGPLDDAARAERKVPKEKTGGIVALN